MKLRPLLLTALCAALCSCKPSRPKIVPYPAAELEAALKADRARTFRIIMDSLTPTGQLVHGTSGGPLHVVGDLQLAAGDAYDGVFEHAGFYEYKAGDGTQQRVRNYICRGPYDIDAQVEKFMKEHRSLK